jgi:hypothetical protein
MRRLPTSAPFRNTRFLGFSVISWKAEERMGKGEEDITIRNKTVNQKYRNGRRQRRGGQEIQTTFTGRHVAESHRGQELKSCEEAKLVCNREKVNYEQKGE